MISPLIPVVFSLSRVRGSFKSGSVCMCVCVSYLRVSERRSCGPGARVCATGSGSEKALALFTHTLSFCTDARTRMHTHHWTSLTHIHTQWHTLCVKKSPERVSGAVLFGAVWCGALSSLPALIWLNSTLRKLDWEERERDAHAPHLGCQIEHLATFLILLLKSALTVCLHV